MKKRRLLSIVLSLCMVLALMPQMVFAETSGDFEYSVSDGKVTITGYTGSEGTVVIPDSINGDPVTAIGSNAFSFKEFNSVTIPDGVTSIGEWAFYGCPYISSVVLPGSVTSVGDWAFDECNSLFAVFISSRSAISYGYNSFPEMASIVKYSLNQSTHEAYITDITLGHISEDYYVSSVNIPEEICGYPVTEVAPQHRGKVGGHKCAGEGATCIVPQVCRICGKTFNPHSYTQENKDLDGALKSAGDCQTEAVYYYSCVHCNEIEGNDNHTFKGDKDSSKHTGSMVWQTTETQHKKYWNCCNADATDYEDHTWSDGKCKVCDYVCAHKDENRDHDCDICGKTISEHTGGTATCTDKALCSICGKEYGNIGDHSFTAETKNSDTLKTAGTCTTEAVYYYSCVVCDSVEKDDNHIFMGAKDPDNHTGGTEIRGAKDATCTEEGYTGDTYCKGCGAILSQGSSENKLKHDLVKTPAKEATVTETGNREYWQCQDCNKYFSDADGTNEIADLESWKTGEGLIDKLPPEIIKGKGQSITAGEKKALSFTSNAAYSDFIRVELDGKTLNKKNYTVKEGSTIVKLKADYVATLSAGKHTIGIVSESGTAETTFTVAKNAAPADADGNKKSPQTGDNTDLAPWIALMILSGAGIGGMTIYTRRKRTNE